MQASRLLSILMSLQAQGRVAARVLAENLEVSVRTIYRDIDELSAAGVPVYAEKGRGGGFVLRGGYRTQLTGLDRPEAESLFLAGVPFAADQLGLGQALKSTQRKLLASLPEATRIEAQRVAARFLLDPIAWFQGAEVQDLLPRLAAAVWEQRRVRIRYESWKAVVERQLSPLGLVLKGGLWYLVAADDRQPRTYRVASILDLVIDEATAAVPAGFDLARYWHRFARDYEVRMQAGRARIRARPAALKPLARMSRAMSLAVGAAGPLRRDGWHLLTIPVESIDMAIGELLRLGPEIQVIGPPELRSAMVRTTRALHAMYSGRPSVRKS